VNLRAACVPLIVAVLATSCDQHLPFTPNIEIQRGNPSASARVGRTASSEGTRHVEGGAGPGALYALDVPENWNGDLVVYAHGYTEESGAPVALPNIAYLRDPLLRRGFAFATSSFSTNGYALKEGFLQTHQLGGLFASKFGPARRTLVIGQSLGGIIALKLAETYPHEYAGALLGCGVVGGTSEEITFIANSKYEKLLPTTRASAVILKRGVAKGVFRPGLDPVDVYITIAAVGYFFLSNNWTLSAIFGRNLAAEQAVRGRRRHNVDMILHALRA